VSGIHRSSSEEPAGQRDGRLAVRLDDETLATELVLVATGVRPATELAVPAGLKLGAADAIDVDRQMRTSAPDVWVGGDCVHTHHQLTGQATYLPLGTTAHKQGRVAGENALGGNVEYAGSLGTQAVKLFDHVAAATGFRDPGARAAGSTRSPSSSSPMTTSGTTPVRPSSGSGSPATGAPAGGWGDSCSGPTVRRSPNGSTCSRPRSGTATPSPG
jgi:pyruvate/2-oxoglutarate dehydrogenase complex dihydrolipoamide dehydrogenase (E3) component